MSVAALFVSLKQQLTTKYGYKSKKMVQDDKFLYAPGDIPVLVIAHLDTVHHGYPGDIYYDAYHQIVWSPTGLGADDRAGVWAIHQLLEMGFRPHVLYTDLEEKGCLGAEQCARVMKDTPPDIKFMVQFDRRGANDCVFYQCDNRDFVKHIEKYGFKEAQGSSTDIKRLMPVWGIAGVNLSVGYYREHSDAEHLNLNQLHHTINRVTYLLNDACGKAVPRFPFVEKATVTYYYTNGQSYPNHKSDTGGSGNTYGRQWLEEFEDAKPGKLANGKKHGQMNGLPPIDRSHHKPAQTTPAIHTPLEGGSTAGDDERPYHWERLLLVHVDEANKVLENYLTAKDKAQQDEEADKIAICLGD